MFSFPPPLSIYSILSNTIWVEILDSRRPRIALVGDPAIEKDEFLLLASDPYDYPSKPTASNYCGLFVLLLLE